MSGKVALEVDRYYYTNYVDALGSPYSIVGFSMDTICENFVRRIIGHGLELSAARETTLKDSIENQKQREQLQKQIAILKA